VTNIYSKAAVNRCQKAKGLLSDIKREINTNLGLKTRKPRG